VFEFECVYVSMCIRCRSKRDWFGVYVCVRESRCLNSNVYTGVGVYVCVYMRVCVLVHGCLCLSLSLSLCVCVSLGMHMYIHI